MKWAYFNRSELVYEDIQGEVEFLVPADPLRALILFKNTAYNNWIVADYLTGIKLGAYRTRKEAKTKGLTEYMSRLTHAALDRHRHTTGETYPEINAIGDKP